MTDGFTCTACGAVLPLDHPAPFRCPNVGDDDVDHVLEPVRQLMADAFIPNSADGHPFVSFAGALLSARLARRLGFSESTFASLVHELDASVADVAGVGVHATPFRSDLLTLSSGHRLWSKDETGQAGGSHKIRHLFGVMLWVRVMQRAGRLSDVPPPFAIASCGNAALAAAIVARAAGVTLNVFIPPDANASVVDAIRAHGAKTHVCPRRAGETGDPCMHAFRRAVEDGQVPFTCQGPENGLVIDGGLTLALEMISTPSERPVSDVVVQVGGGALASAVATAFASAASAGVLGVAPRFHTVQTQGAFPLLRAYDAVRRRVRPDWPSVEDESIETRLAHARELADDADRIASLHSAAVAKSRACYMTPWTTTPTSMATGILDDECYDWRRVVWHMLRTGGIPLVVSEAELEGAWRRVLATGVCASPTGTAGVAGAECLARASEWTPDTVPAVLITG